jgi:Domain of unknown function (DUF4188)
MIVGNPRSRAMIGVFADRYTARAEKPVVVFLIGIRVNKLLAVGKWFPVTLTMSRMLAELTTRPDSGLLFYRRYISGRVLLVQEYWESFDKLLAYAHDRSGQHFPAWAAFNRAIGTMGRSASGTRRISSNREKASASMSTCRDSAWLRRRLTSKPRDGLRRPGID